MAWDVVIGLEVHVQLRTKSKLFSGASTLFGALPNTQTSFIDAGLPGVLPVLNQEAVTMAIQFGLAIEAQINHLSYFERKNYFYPDLPKGYQISQYQCPIVSNGFLMIKTDSNPPKKIDIVRAHLEEDAGKSVHDAHPSCTGIDLNRAGTPLLEIVTAPCLSNAEEAIAYLKTLHELVRFLGICDGNMQEGSFRCDVNISLKPEGSKQLGTRTELKNLNSFRFIEKAIRYEQIRQQERLEMGLSIQQETRLFNPATETTYPLRKKENEQDYRYFPDPDLLPIEINQTLLNTLKKNLPPLPEHIRQTLQQDSMPEEDIAFLLTTPATYHFFCEVQQLTSASAKSIINWLKGPLLTALNEQNQRFDNSPISAKDLAFLLQQLEEQTLSNSAARQVFASLLVSSQAVEDIIAGLQENKVANDTLIPLIEALIKQYPAQVAQYQQGKEKLLAFFVGQIMKATKGQANPEEINALLKTHLSKSSE